MGDFPEDVQLRFQQSATVFKYKIAIVSLNGERGDHPLVRLAKKVHPHVKVQRIVFDDWGVHLRSEVVVLDLRRTAQIRD